MYLVTGASGFCGFEIVRFLVSQGERVRALDIEPLPADLPGVECIRADVRNQDAMDAACSGIDRVIHTAAKVPISKAGKGFWETNVGGTRNVLEAAAQNGVGKFVHISSSAVQLSDQNPVSEDAPYHPVGIYARSKVAAEEVCFDYISKGLDVDIIRPRTVVGSGRLGIFDILFDWISKGRNIYIIGKGNNTIQFLHTGDLALCCYLSSLHPGPETYNVGSREYAPLGEELRHLIAHAGTRSRIISLPILPTIVALAVLDKLRLSPLASWHYLTYHKDFYFTNEKAGRILSWKPRYGNKELLTTAYDDYLKAQEAGFFKYGSSHRKALKQGLLGFLRRIS